VLLSSVLLLQSALAGDPTQHLRYQRAIEMPPLSRGASSTVCAVLDADAFVHAASRSWDDLRVYREADAGSVPVEVPFTLLESEADSDDNVSATVENLAAHGDVLSFDLAMPGQAYTAVELHLAAKDFLAQATVSSAGGQPLGQFTLFDLSREHLARSTELSLQETRLPRLHVVLRIWQPDGTPVTHPSPEMMQGADVPPSREAQTLYTTVAATTDVHAEGPDPLGYSVATLIVPAHVPVERVRFVLDPAFAGSFASKVAIGASPTFPGDDTIGGAESVQAVVSRVDRPARAGAPPVHYASLAVDDTLGSNLRQPARVRIYVQKLDGRPLPLRAVELQMRQRSFCFTATPGERYTLRYGDTGLSPPVYQEMPDTLPNTFAEHVPPSPAQQAQLGPEQRNPAFVDRISPFSVGGSHPEMFWVGLLSMVTLTGALALHRMRPVRGGGGR
jgi:hypothetical protein